MGLSITTEHQNEVSQFQLKRNWNILASGVTHYSHHSLNRAFRLKIQFHYATLPWELILMPHVLHILRTCLRLIRFSPCSQSTGKMGATSRVEKRKHYSMSRWKRRDLDRSTLWTDDHCSFLWCRHSCNESHLLP